MHCTVNAVKRERYPSDTPVNMVLKMKCDYCDSDNGKLRYCGYWYEYLQNIPEVACDDCERIHIEKLEIGQSRGKDG